MRNICFSSVKSIAATIVTIVVLHQCALADQTVGLFLNDTASYSGYTFFTPMNAQTAYLIDPYGRLVHSWETGYFPSLGNYFLENGHVMWLDKVNGTPDAGMHLIEYDWDGNKVWEYRQTSTDFEQHHDIEILPNGNILVLVHEFISLSDAAAEGKDTTGFFGNELYADAIYEIKPVGSSSATVVWKWRVWDHLIQDFDSTKNNFGVVGNHPELVDLNLGDKITDWLHGNSVDYNPALDQIVVSFRSISEFWIIDHSTTTAEAAGHSGGDHGMGGDILYRWGNPRNYRAGTMDDQQLSMQHDVRWIDPGLPGEGHLLMFDNGVTWLHSTAVELVPPVDVNGDYARPDTGQAFGPAAPVWTYGGGPTDGFFAQFISGCQRLANGNTLVCIGTEGEFREVTPSGQIVWRYVNPVGHYGATWQGARPAGVIVFRCYRFAPDFPGLAGRVLQPTAALEGTNIVAEGTAPYPAKPQGAQEPISITSSITSPAVITDCTAMVDTGQGYSPFPMVDDGQHHDGSAGDGTYGTTLPPISDGKTIAYYLTIHDASPDSVSDPPNPPATAYYLYVGYSCGNIDGVLTGGNPTDITDLTYLVDYLFNGGAEPIDLDAANVDGVTSGGLPVDISDLTYLVDFLFNGGPAPVCGS